MDLSKVLEVLIKMACRLIPWKECVIKEQDELLLILKTLACQMSS